MHAYICLFEINNFLFCISFCIESNEFCQILWNIDVSIS